MAESALNLPNVRALAEQLAEYRADYQAADTTYRDRLAAFQAQHAGLLHRREQLKAGLAEIERLTREAAVAWFLATGDKQPTPGVELAMTDVVEIEDEAALIAWCGEHAPDLLSVTVDRKAVEALAKTRRVHLDGVTVRRVPLPRIATRLDAALAGPEIVELGEVPK